MYGWPLYEPPTFLYELGFPPKNLHITCLAFLDKSCGIAQNGVSLQVEKTLNSVGYAN
jgi:hypothetical protein